MKQVSLHSLHDFEKQNAVTLKDGTDLLKCKACGVQGKRHGFVEYIMVPNSVSDSKIQNCNRSKKTGESYKGKFIQITKCSANGRAFENCISESIHQIISPPEKYVNGDGGVWIDGVGEPIKLLFEEYREYVLKKMIRTKFSNK